MLRLLTEDGFASPSMEHSPDAKDMAERARGRIISQTLDGSDFHSPPIVDSQADVDARQLSPLAGMAAAEEDGRIGSSRSKRQAVAGGGLVTRNQPGGLMSLGSSPLGIQTRSGSTSPTLDQNHRHYCPPPHHNVGIDRATFTTFAPCKHVASLGQQQQHWKQHDPNPVPQQNFLYEEDNGGGGGGEAGARVGTGDADGSSAAVESLEVMLHCSRRVVGSLDDLSGLE